MWKERFLIALLLQVVGYLVFLCDAWLLAQLGLNSTYRVKHLSTHFSRVFLCLEVRSKTFPTFIEAQWPETYLPMRTHIYPQLQMHANGRHDDCSRIQQARWSQVDNYSRLWVLDIGWHSDNGQQNCTPKLIVFDLLRNNVEVLRIDCRHYLAASDDTLLSIQMGPKPINGRIEKYIYFLLSNSSSMLAYNIVEQTWHRRSLVSRKYPGVTDPLPIYPMDMAFNKNPRSNELLISDKDGILYTSRNFLLEIESNINDTTNATVITDMTIDIMELELMGSLLGRTIGMMVDYTGALFYAVPKFGAIVRCTYKKNLTAVDNEIIYMTPKTIRQIFFGFEGSVWLLSDRWLNPYDHCFSGV